MIRHVGTERGGRHCMTCNEPAVHHSHLTRVSAQTFQNQICVATVLWQLGGSEPLFLHSRKGQNPVVRLTTPASSSSDTDNTLSVSLPQQTLVLNSRGRSVGGEGDTLLHRVRVRLPRKSDQGLVPSVAPLDHMKAPHGEDLSQAPISRSNINCKN